MINLIKLDDTYLCKVKIEPEQCMKSVQKYK